MRAGGIMRHVRRFGLDRSGAITIEMLASVIVLNIFIMSFYLWWQAYNSHALASRMTYTISDLITRQRGIELDRGFLDGLERTAEFILDPDQDAAIRFTQVTLQPGAAPTDPPTIQVDWSYSPCDALPATEIAAGFDASDLPMMAVGATMIVTDVAVPFSPTFDLVPPMVFERRAVSLYRFEPRFNLAGTGTATCID